VKRISLLVAAIIAAFPQIASAHHAMDGETPSTLAEGLLSGIAHPVIGFDHLAFVVAVGIAAAFTAQRNILPLAFVLATIAGTALHLAAFDLPMVETVIAASVVLAGFMILSGREVSPILLAALFVVGGIFHGYAYGESIVGAETSPLVTYLLGFALVQYVIAIAAGAIVVQTIGAGKKAFENTAYRITGGMVAGAGLFILGNQALAALGFAA
jgi:urease accessory protein